MMVYLWEQIRTMRISSKSGGELYEIDIKRFLS
jgi:hypothetical protein